MRRLVIDKEELTALIEDGLTNKQLATYFNCGLATIKRRKVSYDLVGLTGNKNPKIVFDKKQCTECKDWVLLKEFSFRSDTKHGYMSKCKLCESIRHQEYYVENTDKFISADARRRAISKLCVPIWYNELDAFILKEMIELRLARKQATNVNFHIDHIIPLQSSKACGLHWHKNWQLISERENLRKSNKLLEEYVNA